MIREIKKELKKTLDPITKLSFEVIPQKAMFPHAVADLVVANYKEGLYNIFLDIDVWDKNTSTKNVDEISEKIIKALNRNKFKVDSIVFVCWFAALQNVGSEDKTLRRKTIRFEIKGREGENTENGKV